ncbi:MAG: cytochrome c [Holophagae bacterium]
MNGTRRLVWGTTVVTVSIALSVAAMTATEAIKERHEAMEGIKDEMMVLGAMVKKEQPFDAEVVQSSAAKIADHLARATELFPEGSDTGDVETFAKPEIWTERAKFDEIMERTRQAAVAMQSVTSADEFPPALGALGNGCKSCHDLFRKPKK